MIKAILMLLLIASGIWWLHSLVNWDGECHGDCDECIYDGDCKEQEERKNDKRKR